MLIHNFSMKILLFLQLLSETWEKNFHHVSIDRIHGSEKLYPRNPLRFTARKAIQATHSFIQHFFIHLYDIPNMNILSTSSPTTKTYILIEIFSLLKFIAENIFSWKKNELNMFPNWICSRVLIHIIQSNDRYGNILLSFFLYYKQSVCVCVYKIYFISNKNSIPNHHSLSLDARKKKMVAREKKLGMYVWIRIKIILICKFVLAIASTSHHTIKPRRGCLGRCYT